LPLRRAKKVLGKRQLGGNFEDFGVRDPKKTTFFFSGFSDQTPPHRFPPPGPEKKPEKRKKTPKNTKNTLFLPFFGKKRQKGPKKAQKGPKTGKSGKKRSKNVQKKHKKQKKTKKNSKKRKNGPSDVFFGNRLKQKKRLPVSIGDPQKTAFFDQKVTKNVQKHEKRVFFARGLGTFFVYLALFHLFLRLPQEQKTPKSLL